MSMPHSTCFFTTCAIASRTAACNAPRCAPGVCWSASSISTTFCVRGRLPVWVVRMRLVLVFMGPVRRGKGAFQTGMPRKSTAICPSGTGFEMARRSGGSRPTHRGLELVEDVAHVRKCEAGDEADQEREVRLRAGEVVEQN